MLNEIRANLLELGFKDNEAKAYLALTQLGEATAAQVASKTGLPRTTAISILNKLTHDNFLTTHRYKGTYRYWVESPQTIVSGLETKIKVAQDLSVRLTDLYRSEAHFPQASVFDTKASIRKFIEKTLSQMKRNSVIFTIDAPSEGNYAKVFSDQIGRALFGKKTSQGVHTKTLIPPGAYAGIDPKKLVGQDIELRELPVGLDFRASLWLIGDLLVHFSGNPPFVVAIRHDAIVKGMRAIFDQFWRVAAPVGHQGGSKSNSRLG